MFHFISHFNPKPSSDSSEDTTSTLLGLLKVYPKCKTKHDNCKIEAKHNAIVYALETIAKLSILEENSKTQTEETQKQFKMLVQLGKDYTTLSEKYNTLNKNLRTAQLAEIDANSECQTIRALLNEEIIENTRLAQESRLKTNIILNSLHM